MARLTLLALALAFWLPHARAAAPLAEPDAFRFGADLRARYEYYNRNAGYDGDRGFEDGHEGYFRFRTRVWGEATVGNLTGHLRLGNEFRHYFTPKAAKGRKRFPDELFVDNLWVRASDLWGIMDVTLGRQDITDLGAGRIFGEGTPADGSRSCFYDAARVTFHLSQKRTLDLIALTISHHDWLPTPGHTHGGRGPGSKGYEYDYTMANQREFGLAAYYQDRHNAALGWDAYYVWKAERGAHSTLLALEEGDPDSFQTCTLGFRLLPRFTEHLSGELEAALQVGDESLHWAPRNYTPLPIPGVWPRQSRNHLFAGMGYAGLTYAFAEAPWEPKLTAAVYALSGDSDGTRGGHAWHSVFNRQTFLGDVPGSMFPGLDHNNLIYPHLALKATPGEGQSLALQCGPMFAPVRERDAYGRAGSLRGLYAQLVWQADLGKVLDERFEGLAFTFLGEAMRKGDYFTEGAQDNLGVYLCWELTYAF